MDKLAKFDKLKREAIRSCKFREHEMGTWHDLEKYAVCVCQVCGKRVAVAPSPTPNGIEIGGEAVALNCM